MNLNADEFRDKVLACWLGKNLGGTLGAPMEWRRQVNNVTFYTQNLEGEPALNDDLHSVETPQTWEKGGESRLFPMFADKRFQTDRWLRHPSV